MKDKRLEHIQDGLQNMRDAKNEQLKKLEFNNSHAIDCDCRDCHCSRVDKNTDFSVEYGLCNDKYNFHNERCRYGCCECLEHKCGYFSCDYFEEELEKQEID